MAALFIALLFCHGGQASERPLKITYMDYPGAIDRYGQALENAYQKIGIDIEFIKLSDGISIKDTNQGAFDGDLMRGAGMEKSFPNLIPVGSPIESAKIVILCQKGAVCTPDIINSSETLVYSVESAKTWNYALKTTSVSVAYQASLKSLKAIFLAKKIKYMVFTLDASGFFNADALNANVMSKPLMTVDAHHYIHKKHLKLVPALAKAIDDEFSARAAINKAIKAKSSKKVELQNDNS
mgnify:CR=1 FL=1